jgi:hypothetical protein
MAEVYNFENIDLSCLTSSTFSIVSITLNVIVSSGTIFGNTLVIVSIYKYQNKFKGSLYMLIGNLAAADLLLGLWLLVFIFEEIFPDVKQNWHYCVVKPVGILVSYGCSILSLLAISFDRFMAVLFPLKHFLKTNKRKVFFVYMGGMWTVAILIGSLPVILQNLQPPNDTFVCRIGAIVTRDFDYTSSTLIIVTMIVDVILYGMVIWKMKTNKTPGNSATQKKNTKTLLMIGVFVLFVVCWIPFVICSLMMQTVISPITFQNIICVREYLVKLGLIHSALNWIIYGLANKKFRIAFKKILSPACCIVFSQSLSMSSRESRDRRIGNNIECSVSWKM